MLKFKGAQQLRQRLVFATLSSRAVQISDIRVADQSPGLRDFEACLLRLLEKVTDGCTVEINETGEPTDVRVADWSPGLRDFEACLLRLLEKVTDGCTVEINETGKPCHLGYTCG